MQIPRVTKPLSWYPVLTGCTTPSCHAARQAVPSASTLSPCVRYCRGGRGILLFLDYYATGKLNVDVAADVIEGIGKGVTRGRLVGGETAEMPGMYEGDDYDLAGFCVGVVEKIILSTVTKLHRVTSSLRLPHRDLIQTAIR